MDNLQFGAFVAQLRKEQNMTQKELADALHVTDKAVSKWETGKGFPDVKLLEPLARALGVSLVELMRGQRLEADALPVAEAEQMVSQAMGRSQRSTARRYLKLLSALLIGIGGLCLLQLIPIIGFLIYLGQFNPLFAADDYGIIGGADGPTAIITATPAFPWWDMWGAPITAAIGLILCIVLTIKVKRLTKDMK